MKACKDSCALYSVAIRFKRTLLAALLLTTAVTTQAMAANDNWRFKVLLDGDPIGQHNFSVATNSGQIQVRNNASFAVKFLGFTAYTYQHNAAEQWQSHCLSRMQTSTNDNGEALKVNARRMANTNSGLTVNTGKTENTLPGCIRSFAYWNLAYMKSPQLLNAQTGELVRTQFKPMGSDTLTAAGQTVPAQRYRLTGKDIQIDLWYSNRNRWLGLESLKDGKRIRYVLQ